MLHFGKLYQLNISTHFKWPVHTSTSPVNTLHSWTFIDRDTVFVLLYQHENFTYYILLPNGETGHIYADLDKFIPFKEKTNDK